MRTSDFSLYGWLFDKNELPCWPDLCVNPVRLVGGQECVCPQLMCVVWFTSAKLMRGDKFNQSVTFLLWWSVCVCVCSTLPCSQNFLIFKIQMHQRFFCCKFFFFLVILCNITIWTNCFLCEHHYCSLQCHMILQKSLWYEDLVLINIYYYYYQCWKYIFFQYSLMNRKKACKIVHYRLEVWGR